MENTYGYKLPKGLWLGRHLFEDTLVPFTTCGQTHRQRTEELLTKVGFGELTKWHCKWEGNDTYLTTTGLVAGVEDSGKIFSIMPCSEYQVYERFGIMVEKKLMDRVRYNYRYSYTKFSGQKRSK